MHYEGRPNSYFSDSFTHYEVEQVKKDFCVLIFGKNTQNLRLQS